MPVIYYYLLFIFNLLIVDKFYFNLQLDYPSTNSKTCFKPSVRLTILQNVGIADTRHLRQNLSLSWKNNGKVKINN